MKKFYSVSAYHVSEIAEVANEIQATSGILDVQVISVVSNHSKSVTEALLNVSGTLWDGDLDTAVEKAVSKVRFRG